MAACANHTVPRRSEIESFMVKTVGQWEKITAKDRLLQGATANNAINRATAGETAHIYRRIA